MGTNCNHSDDEHKVNAEFGDLDVDFLFLAKRVGQILLFTLILLVSIKIATLL